MSDNTLGNILRKIADLPSLWYGVLYDLLEKLTGRNREEWYETLKQFLRREPCWLTRAQLDSRESDADVIMRRLLELSSKTAVMFRSTFCEGDPRRWYVSCGSLLYTSKHSNGGYTPGADGPTPEAALRATWEQIQNTLMFQKDTIIMKYSCPSNVPIPGDDPQAWITWEDGAWVDVVPTERMLAAHGIPRDRVVPYKSLQ